MREKRLVTKDLIPQFNTLIMRLSMERNDSVFLFQAGAHCKLRKKPVYIPMAFVGGAEGTRTARRAPQARNPRLPLRQQRGAKGAKNPLNIFQFSPMLREPQGRRRDGGW